MMAHSKWGIKAKTDDGTTEKASLGEQTKQKTGLKWQTYRDASIRSEIYPKVGNLVLSV